MELDLQSLFGLLCTCSCTHWLRPRNSPLSPRIWALIRGRYWSANPLYKTKKKMRRVVFQLKCPLNSQYCPSVIFSRKAGGVDIQYMYRICTCVSLYLKTTVCKPFYIIILFLQITVHFDAQSNRTDRIPDGTRQVKSQKDQDRLNPWWNPTWNWIDGIPDRTGPIKSQMK